MEHPGRISQAEMASTSAQQVAHSAELVHEGLVCSWTTLFLRALALLMAASWSRNAEAQSLERDWTSARYAGMGFATVAISNDAESPFANPAGLARMRNPRSRSSVHEVHFPRVNIMTREEHAHTINATIFTRPGETLQRISREFARNTAMRESRTEVSMYPNIVFGGKSKPTFLFGIYGNSRLHLERRAETAETLADQAMQATRDLTIGATIGFAGVTRAGTFAYGLSLRPNARYFEVNEDFDADVSNPSENLTALPRTTGIGIDAGLLFTAADFWLPTIAVAVRNAPTGACVENVENPFSGDLEAVCGSVRSGVTDPAHVRTRLDPIELRAGVSMTPRFRTGRSRLNLRLSGEISPISIAQGGSQYGYSHVPLDQMLKAGLEIFFGHPLIFNGNALRGGLYNGDLTWGASLQAWALTLEYASFVQQYKFTDQSTSKTRQHLVSLSTRW